MNVLAIGCHPDDIEISCSGTLAKCVKRGDKVTVLITPNLFGNLISLIPAPQVDNFISKNFHIYPYGFKTARTKSSVKYLLAQSFNSSEVTFFKASITFF